MGFEKGNTIGKDTQFTSDNQPKNKGRKGKSISDFLKEYGENNKIEYEITTIDSDDKKKTSKGMIDGQGSTINELVAFTILKNALYGDNKAITTLLERTEGKVPLNLNHGGQDGNPVKVEQIKGMTVK